MNRRGYSLIQLTLLMPALVVLFLTAVAWIHQTMTFSSNMKKQQLQHQNLTRLASRFRQDVQRCQAVSVVNDQQVCLQYPDRSEINYTITDEGIQFWQNTPDGQRIRQDQFELASGSISKFDATELPTWISLLVTRQPGANRQSSEQNTPSNQALITELHLRSKPNRWGMNLLPDAESLPGEIQ